MMKRVGISILASFVFAIMFLLMPVNGLLLVDNATAEMESKTSQQIALEIDDELRNFIEYDVLTSAKERQSRIPGSEAEYNSAKYIHSELLTLSKFKPVENTTTKNGYEFFDFKSNQDGKTYTSQNIVFKRESTLETNKKVVLGTHYDTAYVAGEGTSYSKGQGVVSDGINDNAGSVATLLTLVKNLDKIADFSYDIEVVFFGAGTNSYAGAKHYVSSISQSEEKDILLMVNLDRIVIGKYTYAYINEYKTPQHDYIFEVLGEKKSFKELKNENTVDYEGSGLHGLDYTHIGIESDHKVFMQRGINTINVFSGDYESAFTIGLKEFEGEENITFTARDTYGYIQANHSEYSNSLADISLAINNLLMDEDFLKYMQKNNGSDEFYGFWANEKRAVFITAILFVVFIAIFYVIYHILLKRSRKVFAEKNVDTIVFKITSNLGENDETINQLIDKKIKNDTENTDNKDKEE